MCQQGDRDDVDLMIPSVSSYATRRLASDGIANSMHPREKVDSLSGGICGTVICFPFMFIHKWIRIKNGES